MWCVCVAAEVKSSDKFSFFFGFVLNVIPIFNQAQGEQSVKQKNALLSLSLSLFSIHRK